MKILVTGGAGFIGSHTVVELQKSGFEPVIIDNFSNSEEKVLEGLEKIIGKPVVCYKADCNDEAALRQLFEKENIEGVIHFAANKAVGESVENPLLYYGNNIGTTVLLLKLMKEFEVHNFVFSSSCTVYGQPDQLPVTEATPRQEAASPYGNTKKICEDIIRDFIFSKPSMKAIALRYFNPIGAHETAEIGELPRGVPSNLVPYITQTAAGLRQKLTVFGSDYNTPDGTCIRDFIHVVDLAKAHVKALELLAGVQEENFYDVFNIGTGEGVTVLQLIKTFEEVNNLKLNYSIGPRRPGDVEQIYAQVDKSREVMKWQTEKTLEDSLRDAWRWEQKLATRKK
ncbi:UDP-glucose 4-epimerase GalE [Runella slithyformis]|uniref:UDP-glucose 4-epimerase n=1 Tax=Runella slithyformis (strain ATCC 29530 / DSM 19594 / LMG 11500 / NCIMB 11436 / LSU 4) TaxID=761193 RepID=A0A7U4E628_RUNSL|nr:UDP-glucose 4-epimerase GalE [Runella slithyformis]AEI48779.1 UDP-glucose 4-epimerase [Runella slithyformis DSM 19594]